jgi:hypothetical protein
MSGEVISTNMSLPIPTVASTSGPTWASDLNSCLTIIDQHDHTAGSGARITPSGMNIISDLPFNGYSATMLLKTAFSSQTGALTGTNFLSVVSGNLYFNDSSGNQIPITSGGGVAGSPGSIGSLSSPASATYVAGSKLFQWRADSGKAAAMDNGAVTIRETNVASAKGVTLASPTSLAADYQLTFPTALPATTRAVISDATGNLGYITYDAIGSGMTSVGADAIGATMTATGANAIGTTMTSTGANAVLADVTSWTPTSIVANSVAAARTRATGTSVAAGGVAISATCGAFSDNSGSFVDVTNLSVTIISSGRPVEIRLVSDASGSASVIEASSASNGSPQGLYKILRGATEVAQYSLSAGDATKVAQNPSSAICVVDAVAAGTYTYKLQARLFAGSLVKVSFAKLIAYEL